jgi:hypothetical protein
MKGSWEKDGETIYHFILVMVVGLYTNNERGGRTRTWDRTSRGCSKGRRKVEVRVENVHSRNADCSRLYVLIDNTMFAHLDLHRVHVSNLRLDLVAASV